MKNNIYVVGHKNPDTDSICSAIAYANLKKELGLWIAQKSPGSCIILESAYENSYHPYWKSWRLYIDKR